MGLLDKDSENIARIADAVDPPDYSSGAGPDVGPVGAIFLAFLATVCLTVPIGFVMWILGIPTVYENLVFWPTLIGFCYLLWPKK